MKVIITTTITIIIKIIAVIITVIIIIIIIIIIILTFFIELFYAIVFVSPFFIYYGVDVTHFWRSRIPRSDDVTRHDIIRHGVDRI